MKKITAFLMCLMLSFSLAACSSNQQPQNSTSALLSESGSEATPEPETSAPISNEPEETKTEDEKTLVVYFSWSGNTEEMAHTIATETGGELYEIVPLNAYPEDYDECTDVALKERDNNARPEIGNLPELIDEYDRIIIGYPIWWHTAPMVIGTFLESYDLNNVDVYPFTQSASMSNEQYENSMEFVRKTAAGANVHDGLFADADDTEAITSYLEQNGLTN
ncbi:flavodoxin [Lacrimispora sp.]|uniref:flavodoxin n=1 Tax=Lacrimispora sp. TaxID=2719234 RepID=UPI0032E41C94